MSDKDMRELAVRVATPPHVVQTSEAVRLAEAVLALMGEGDKPVAAPWSKSDFEAVVKRQVGVIASLREVNKRLQDVVTTQNEAMTLQQQRIFGLEKDLEEARAAFALHCAQCPQCQDAAVKAVSGGGDHD